LNNVIKLNQEIYAFVDTKSFFKVFNLLFVSSCYLWEVCMLESLDLLKPGSVYPHIMSTQGNKYYSIINIISSHF